MSRDPLVAHLGKQLLLASDLTAASRPAEERAMKVAEQTGARLAILAVVPAEDADDRAVPRQLEARVRLARRRGIDVRGWVATGDPGECVVEAAGAIGADAIIMGPDQWRTLRTPSCPCGHVILRAPCSVLITRAG